MRGCPLEFHVFGRAVFLPDFQFGIMPFPVRPNKRVCVDSQVFRLAEIHNFVGRGASPVGHTLWIFYIFPKFLRVPVFGFETRLVELHFKTFPVERHRSRIEQAVVFVVKAFVDVVVFFFSELVEVENVRPEKEFVRNLPYFYGRIRRGVERDFCVCLAEFFDAFVDGLLNIFVPDIPVGFRHNRVFVGFVARRNRGRLPEIPTSALRRVCLVCRAAQNRKRQCRNRNNR